MQIGKDLSQLNKSLLIRFIGLNGWLDKRSINYMTLLKSKDLEITKKIL